MILKELNKKNKIIKPYTRMLKFILIHYNKISINLKWICKIKVCNNNLNNKNNIISLEISIIIMRINSNKIWVINIKEMNKITNKNILIVK